MLAKRLINDSSASDDAESNMITKLKDACGFEYTSKLTRMFQDMALCKDMNMQFKEKVALSDAKDGGECVRASSWADRSQSTSTFLFLARLPGRCRSRARASSSRSSSSRYTSDLRDSTPASTGAVSAVHSSCADVRAAVASSPGSGSRRGTSSARSTRRKSTFSSHPHSRPVSSCSSTRAATVSPTTTSRRARA